MELPTSLGNLFQCLTTFLNKLFLKSHLNLPSCNLKNFLQLNSDDLKCCKMSNEKSDMNI